MFYGEVSGLHQAAFLLGTFAILSQVLALIRDRLFAHSLGAGTTLDLYYAAFRIPDFIFVSIASLVSITVLIPLITERMHEDKEKIRSFINNIFTAFLIGIVLVSVVAFFFIPSLSASIFPGFSAEEHSVLVTLTRILLLSPILLGISNLFGSITQTFRRFFVYALSPVFYNIGIIVGMLFFYPVWGISGLVWGVVLGALLHLSIQIPVVVRQHLMPRLIFSLDRSLLRRVVLLSLPRTLGLSAHHIAFIVLVGLASLMVEGSISIFSLSWNLQSVPLAIIGVSYSVAAFPTLARLYSSSEVEKFVDRASAAVNLSLRQCGLTTPVTNTTAKLVLDGWVVVKSAEYAELTQRGVGFSGDEGHHRPPQRLLEGLEIGVGGPLQHVDRQRPHQHEGDDGEDHHHVALATATEDAGCPRHAAIQHHPEAEQPQQPQQAEDAERSGHREDGDDVQPVGAEEAPLGGCDDEPQAQLHHEDPDEEVVCDTQPMLQATWYKRWPAT